MFKKKNRVKPLFKQLIKLRENVQGRTKILNFRHKKWKTFIEKYSKKLKKRYVKFKPQDQTKYTITRYPNKGTALKKQFRNSFNSGRKLRLFYGGLLKKNFKKQLKIFNSDKNKKTNINLIFLKLFEQRLDSVLFRSKFAKSFRNARQMITHEKIRVNGKVVKSPSFILKKGDLISVNFKYHEVVIKNLQYCLQGWVNYNARLWPLPPKHLIINYTTMEIFFDNLDITNLSTDFSFNLNLEKVLLNYSRQ